MSETVPQAGMFEIVWRGAGFKSLWHVQGEVREEHFDEKPLYMTVIGNVFENPKLLK